MGELKSIELDQLLEVFREQSLQIVDEMSHDLLALESQSGDEEAMTRLRRGAHTIKGDSACIGFEGMARVAHKIEDTFAAAIEGSVVFDRGSVDVMLGSLDAIKSAINGEEIRDLDSETVNSLIHAHKAIESPGSVGFGAAGAREASPVQQQSSTVGHAGAGRRHYVRVESRKMDSLLNLAGEMVIARSVINQIQPELEREFPRNELVSRLGAAGLHLGKLIAELQKSVLKMRMVTIDQLFRRFARPMRELAGDCGKEIELQTEGTETELDRTLVDQLYEPLLHLLRNAVDHALETVEERLALGKPRAGRIVTRAYHETNQVILEIEDDGRGIDISAVKEKAIQRGLITREQAEKIPDDEAIELVFAQGLSTTEQITQLSGRGIGMTAVKSAVEQLRGTIVVQTQPKRGTRFTIRLPLTLAIIRALLFTAAGRLLALPLLSVTEITTVRPSDIINLGGTEQYRIHDRFVSLVRPSAVLGFDRRRGGSGAALRSEPAQMFLIVLLAGNKHYAVVVDEIIGEQELVIKPLADGWVENDALTGAALLGDGRVVLILDAETVFKKAVKYEQGQSEYLETYAI